MKKIIFSVIIFILCICCGLAQAKTTQGGSARIQGIDICNPSKVAGPSLKHMYRANTSNNFTFSSGSSISSWIDLVGGKPLIQASVPNQPTYSSTNKRVVFNGTATILATAALSSAIAHPATVVIVAKHNATGDTVIMDGADATHRFLFVGQGGGVTDGIYSGAGPLTGGTQDTSLHAYIGVFNTTSSAFYIDGGTALSTGDSGSQSLLQLVVGAAYNGTAFFNGEVAEIRIYSGVMTASDMNAIGSCIQRDHGVSWSTYVSLGTSLMNDNFDDVSLFSELFPGTEPYRWTNIEDTVAANTQTLETTTVNTSPNSIKFYAEGTTGTLSKSSILREVYSFGKGTTVHTKTRYYIPSAQSITNITIQDLECNTCWDPSNPTSNTYPGLRLQVDGNDYLYVDRAKIGFATTFDQVSGSEVALPRDEWFQIEWALVLGINGEGRTIVVLNGNVIIDAQGTNMPDPDVFTPLGVALIEPVVYEILTYGISANSGATAVTLYIDDVEVEYY